MNVVTKWRRVCSPSVTMSMPACSWSKSASRTASRLPCASASPSSFQGAHSWLGSASQAGFGQAAGDGGGEERHDAQNATGAKDARPPSAALARSPSRSFPNRSGHLTTRRRPVRLAALRSRFCLPMARILYADNDYPDIDLERAMFEPAGHRDRGRAMQDRGGRHRQRPRLPRDPPAVRADHRARRGRRCPTSAS